MKTIPCTQIDTLNGRVIFPADWFVLKNRNPEECSHVGVIYVNENAKCKMSHFLFFSTVPVCWRYMSKQEKEELLNACIDAYPDFKEIVEQQPALEKLTPPERCGAPIINAEEVPILGDPYITPAIVIWE